MSEFSENVLITFQNIQQIYKDVSSLLQDADGLMEQSGYQCLHGNWVGTESSKHVQSPLWWIYPYLTRYYADQENPFDIRAIGVYFMDHRQTPVEPMLLFGSFLVPGIEIQDRKYHYTFLRDAWFKSGVEYQPGQAFEVNNLAGVEKGRICGLLLESITGLDSLKTLVIEPLLAMSF